MTGGDNPRERADGWFDILETTTIGGLQTSLDSIGMLRARLIAGDTGLSGLARETLLARNATGMPRDTVRSLGRWAETGRDATDPESHLYRGERASARMMMGAWTCTRSAAFHPTGSRIRAPTTGDAACISAKHRPAGCSHCRAGAASSDAWPVTARSSNCSSSMRARSTTT